MRGDDQFYMRIALQLAEAVDGQTGVNPAVGCVVVKDGRIVGMGAHLKAGTAHAEVHALNMAGAEAAGATAYVTLEPCAHHGRTPPCSDRLIADRVARVVVACRDPNPKVNGGGIAKLLAAGIEVTTGILEQEALALNERFFHFILNKRPFVAMKTASTADGKIASKSGDSKWITGEESRGYVHSLRHTYQGIMVGAGTVLADDPQLTTRLPAPAMGRNPVRVIADSMLRVPLTAQVFDHAAPTIVLTTERADASKRAALEELGVTVLICGNGPRVDLREAMHMLTEREVSSILLEGGATLNGAMLEAGLIDKCYMFFAPKLIGGLNTPGTIAWDGIDRMADAIELERISTLTFGRDVCIVGYPVYKAGEANVHGNR